MTEVINQTIGALNVITKLLQETDYDDLETIRNIDSLLLDVHHSLHAELNRKVMQDATKQAEIQAYIRNLGHLYKNAILTVL